MKIDLDEMEVSLSYDEMEVSLSYMGDWKQLIKELRAARDFIFEIRRLDYLPIVAKALKEYDEARRGW